MLFSLYQFPMPFNLRSMITQDGILNSRQDKITFYRYDCTHFNYSAKQNIVEPNYCQLCIVGNLNADQE